MFEARSRASLAWLNGNSGHHLKTVNAVTKQKLPVIKKSKKNGVRAKKEPMYMTMRRPNLSDRYPEKGEPMMFAKPMAGKINPTVDMGIPRIECK